jgi:hypothetical protein
VSHDEEQVLRQLADVLGIVAHVSAAP